ncbi:kinase-like domain-containing protein [Gigaspora rosea]|uniref:Kinase-like domain-containing protein n=1 Tax=Gigaspora rosea TaxID=44941 RepID=A0A397VHG5_9GLOM|nr:kinase-like domain-containing protein [Gigaspora rosea]
MLDETLHIMGQQSMTKAFKKNLKLTNYTDYAEEINISVNTDYAEDIDISDDTAFAEESMSKDPLINEFIRNDDRLRWIPYEELTSIEHLANGGFGVVLKAKWRSKEVVLKSLNNSKHLTADILQEITQHQRHYNQLSLKDKLGLLYSMINGLYHIHAQGLIHKDFHPVDEANNSKKNYRVLPYIAPEVLKEEPYTQALIFILLEWLRMNICNELRPNLDIAGVPQLLKALIVECWDDNPLLRPKADHLRDYFRTWYTNIDWNLEFRKQYKVDEELLTSNNPTYQKHPQAIYTSRLLDLNSRETDFYISEKFSGLDITNNV